MYQLPRTNTPNSSLRTSRWPLPAPSIQSEIRYPISAILITLALLLTCATCRRSPTSAPLPESSEPGMSPSEGVLAIHRARTHSNFDAIPKSLAPGSQTDHVAVILAVDQVLAANAALQHALIQRYGSATAADFDLSDMGQSFGVFSRDIRIVKEHITADRATVTIQEGNNVPLRDVALTLRDGRWLLTPEPPEPGLIPRLQKLARTLDQMRATLDNPNAPFEDLAASFRLQVWPQLESIAVGR